MYNQIIDEIKSNLSGNNESDREYLITQLDKYKDHEYAQEITREIGRMMWDLLSDEEKDQFAKTSEEENHAMDVLMQANDYLNNNDLRAALNLLDDFIKDFPLRYQDDKVNEYHSFENPLEEALFDKYIKCEKELRYIPDNQPLFDLFYMYGSLLLEFSRFEDAENALSYALKLNPVSTRAIYEISEIYKTRGDLDKFYDNTISALSYSYSSSDLARGYRNLGYYFIEKEDFELATALFNFSLSYDYNPMAFSEIEYIRSKGFDESVSDDRALELLEKNNIQTGPNPEIMNLLTNFVVNFEFMGYLNSAIFFYRIAYDLTGDEAIMDKIKSLQESI